MIAATCKRLAASGASPLGRSSSACAVISNHLYCFSGEHTPRIPIDNAIESFDLTTATWITTTIGSAAPIARVGHAAAKHGNQIFFYGGRSGVQMDESTLSDFWSFDVHDKRWQQLSLSDAHAPPPLSYHTMTASDHSIFVFGGCALDHSRSNRIHRYSLARKVWELVECKSAAEESPCGRGGASIVNATDGLHVLFGFNGKVELDDHWLFDKDSKRWIPVHARGPIPPARSVTDVVFLSEVGSKGSLFVFGGEFTPSASGHDGAGAYHDDAWLFSVADQSWMQVDLSGAERPSARGWFNTCASDNKSAIIFGGFDGTARLNDVWKISFT